MTPVQLVISWQLEKRIQSILVGYRVKRPQWIEVSQYHHTIWGEFCESKYLAVFLSIIFLKEWHQYLFKWEKRCSRICESNIPLTNVLWLKWHTVYEETFATILFSPLLPLLSSGKIKSGWIPISQNITLKTQWCLGEFKTGLNCLQV